MKTIGLFYSNIVFLVFLTSGITVSAVRADTHQESLRLVIASGKEYLRQEKYVEASHQFTKALHLDPFNSEAKYYYDLCSASFYGRRIADLPPEWEEKYLHFGSEPVRQQPAPVTTEYTMAPSSHPAYRIRRTRRPRQSGDSVTAVSATGTTSADWQVAQNVQSTVARKEQEEATLNAIIQDTDQQVAQKAGLVAAKEQELDGIRAALTAAQEDFAAVAAEREQIRRRQNQDLDELRREIVQKEQDNQELKKKIAAVKLDNKKHSALENAMMESMKTMSRERSEEIAKLKLQLAKMADREEEQGRGLQKKDQTIAALKQQLAARQTAIGGAQRSLARTQKELAAATQQIRKLQEAISGYKQSLSKADSRRNQNIENLETLLFKNRMELAYLNNKTIVADYYLSEGQAQAIEKNRRILELLDKVSKLEQETVHLQSQLIAREDGEQSPAGRIDKNSLIKRQDIIITDLKERLAKTILEKNTAMAAAKDSGDTKQIAKLEALLSSLSAQLSQANDSLQRKAQECRFLEAQINAAQQQLDSAAKNFVMHNDQLSILTPASINDATNASAIE